LKPFGIAIISLMLFITSCSNAGKSKEEKPMAEQSASEEIIKGPMPCNPSRL